MDNLAHTLIGVAVARSGLSEKLGKGATLTLALASNLPDVDVLWTSWNRWDMIFSRRTHSHSLLMAPVLALGLAALLRPFLKALSFRALFSLSLLGIGLHLVFDLVNSYGVVILWPFSRQRFELPCVYIVDLGIWAITAAPLLFQATKWKTRAFRGSLAALALYVGLCMTAGWATERIVARETAGLVPGTLKVFPEPLGPQNFRAAVKDGTSWRLYRVHLPSGRCELKAVIPTDEASERVRAVRAGHDGCQLDWFMAAPVWTRRPDDGVEIRDLRFQSLVLPWRADIFRFEAPPGTDKVRLK